MSTTKPPRRITEADYEAAKSQAIQRYSSAKRGKATAEVIDKYAIALLHNPDIKHSDWLRKVDLDDQIKELYRMQKQGFMQPDLPAWMVHKKLRESEQESGSDAPEV